MAYFRLRTASKHAIFSISLILLSVVLSPPARAEPGQQPSNSKPERATGSVQGVIQFSGDKLAGATVSVVGQHIAVITDHSGRFELKNLPSGKITLLVDRFGFKPQSIQLTQTQITEGKPLLINLSATEQVQRLKQQAANTNFAEHIQQKQDYLAGIAMGPIRKASNIIFILFDDLGYGDLSAYGNKLIKTPNLDALARKGAKFTNFYAGAPSCTPSRASFLTGRYAPRSLSSHHVSYPKDHPVSSFRLALGYANGLPQDEILISEVLQAAGYRTAMIGKWHLGDQHGQLPNDFGFDHFYGVLHSNNMTPLFVYRNGQAILDSSEYRQEQLTNMYTDEAIEILRDSSDKPLFLYLAHTFPHTPHHADPKFAGTSAAGLYGDVVEDLDRNVERLVAELRRNSMLEDTLLIITSDNGAGPGGSSFPYRGRKGQILEGGMRVPFIVHWPIHVAGAQTIDGISIGADLFPTLAELAGVRLPEDRVIDGRSFMPLLNGQRSEIHQQIYYFHSRTAEPLAVRQDRYKFIGKTQRPLTLATYPVAGRFQQHFHVPALYDVSLDTVEAHNLLDKLPKIGRELDHMLNQMRTQMDTNIRGWR